MNNAHRYLKQSPTHTCALTTNIRQQFLFLCLFYLDDTTQDIYEATKEFTGKQLLLQRAKELNFNFIPSNSQHTLSATSSFLWN